MLFRYLWIIFIAATIVSACGSDDEDEKDTTPKSENLGPGSLADDYATSDNFFTPTSDFVATEAPHNLVRIWYSSNLSDLIPQGEFTAPVGTVSVKQFFPGGEVDGEAVVVVMIKKQKGYDPDNNDWYFERRSPDGEVVAQGKGEEVSGCQGCHSKYSISDFLAGTSVKD